VLMLTSVYLPKAAMALDLCFMAEEFLKLLMLQLCTSSGG